MALEKVVILARHGARSPLMTADDFTLLSQKKWPEWPVENGMLTPRGAELIRSLWREMRREFDRAGFLPEADCLEQSMVYIRADNEPRTEDSAAAIFDGLAPACDLTFHSLRGTMRDPLFHPETGSADAERERLGRQLEAAGEKLRASISVMSAVLGALNPALCDAAGLPPGCVFMDLAYRPPHSSAWPPVQSPVHEGKQKDFGPLARLKLEKEGGAVETASSLAETWLMQGAQWPGLPNPEVGFGELDQSCLENLLSVHVIPFNIVKRAPEFARRHSAPMLAAIRGLFGREPEQRPDGNRRNLFIQEAYWDALASRARLVVFVGHDTDIAALAGALDLHWSVDGYPPDSVPPASMLAFCRWGNGEQRRISVHFICQTLDVLLGTDAPGSPDGLLFQKLQEK